MSEGGGGSRKPKGAGLGRDAVVAVARRSPRRSSLFWWLFDHYDELIEAKGLSALGLSWKSMCAGFVELELSSSGRGGNHPGTSQQDVAARSEGKGAACRAESEGGG